MSRKKAPDKKPFRKKKKTPPIYVPNEAVKVPEWIPTPDHINIDLETNNWYDIKAFLNEDAEQPDWFFNLKYRIPDASYEQQMKTIKRRKLDKRPLFISTRKIRIYPTPEQEKILQIWFNTFAHMFNITIAFLRTVTRRDGRIDFQMCSEHLNFESVRKVLYEDKSKIKENMDVKQTPTHILDEAIHLAVANYKTCVTNLKSGLIKKFRVREWSKNRRRKIIKIESSFFKNGTFCSSVFPTMEASESLDGINTTATLQYDSDAKRYLLLVPEGREPEWIRKVVLSCGIDLGVREFACVYSEMVTMGICNNSQDNRKIKNYQKKIDNIHKMLIKSKDYTESLTMTKKETG